GELDRFGFHFALNGMENVHFKRSADVVAGQVFQALVNDEAIWARSPYAVDLEVPARLFFVHCNSAGHFLPGRVGDPDEAVQKCMIERLWKIYYKRLPFIAFTCKKRPMELPFFWIDRFVVRWTDRKLLAERLAKHVAFRISPTFVHHQGVALTLFQDRADFLAWL